MKCAVAHTEQIISRCLKQLFERISATGFVTEDLKWIEGFDVVWDLIGSGAPSGVVKLEQKFHTLTRRHSLRIKLRLLPGFV